jgi:hypothetical protein
VLFFFSFSLICLILKVLHVNFDFKLVYLNLFTNLIDGNGGFDL